MSKAYSNKALPPGTVLREWRLEDVLGVGGFGIVYKGRGIYFDELVAIKEYFPSSISERDAEDTVVPIDSDAEEVHALGLKKFVEEAKLLWNLSTPTRHPNIVNVRSLFEVHGTAYMVMDFEDGNSLSRLLKQGQRFNERSLLNIVRPIAEGLDRAHRVGVLHRDIKPPNILINPDGRPVLIDFGSARFEAAEATSTTVTFHTPPYAAIEQYVKTYPQGPWTDIYALGVVLYECVTGEKPPEVLERMHGGLGTKLAAGHWPGYSPKFLTAIDAAMTIRPDERPRSISDWLTLLDGANAAAPTTTVEIDEDATRFVAYDKAVEAIVPVAPPASSAGEKLDTRVPEDPSEVQFKRAGHETGVKKKATHSEVPPLPEPAVVEPKAKQVAATPSPVEPAALKTDDAPAELDRGLRASLGDASSTAGKDADTKTADKAPSGRKISPLFVGGSSLALLVAVAGGYMMSRGTDSGANPDAAPIVLPTADPAAPASAQLPAIEALPTAATALANDARAINAPAEPVDALVAMGDALTPQVEAFRAMVNDPAKADAARASADAIRSAATAGAAAFASALQQQTEATARKLSREVPWANPSDIAASRTENSVRQGVAVQLRDALAGVQGAAATAASATDPAAGFADARKALEQWRIFASATAAAYRSREVVRTTAVVPTVKAERVIKVPTIAAGPVAVAVETAPVASESSGGVSSAKMSQFNAILSEANGMASQVMRSGTRENQQLARGYSKYLTTLKSSMRGVNSDRGADRLISSAKQTRAYLQFLVKQSANDQ